MERRRNLRSLALLVVLAVSVGATLALSATAWADSGPTVTREHSGSRGGDLERSDEAAHCAAPADMDAGQIEAAEEPQGEADGSVERADDPRYCEGPADQERGVVIPSK